MFPNIYGKSAEASAIPATLPTGGVTGAQLPLNYNASTGGTPVLPSPGTSAGLAVKQNLGNLNDILNLVGQTNASNLTQATAPYLALPGYQSSLDNVGANIGQMTSGQLPADVVNQIAQAAAERGVAQGGFRNADYLKALGLNSLQMQQQGQAALNSATAALPRPAILNPTTMFVSPQEQQQAAASQSLYNAAPVPQNSTNAALAASRAGQQAGNQPATIARPTSATTTGNDTLAAVQDLLKRYSGKNSDPTQGSGSLSVSDYAPDANSVIDTSLPENDAYFNYIMGMGPDPYTDTSQYFDYTPTAQTPDVSLDETMYA